MKSSQGNEQKEIRMELKYCERCGGLWFRECGSGVVYCEPCQGKVDDLPMPKKKRPGRLLLPVRGPAAVDDYKDDYEIEIDDPARDFEAEGRAA